MKNIRILLVDDEVMVRAGLRMRLELETDFTVVGEAENGEQAARKVPDTLPEVVLMDISMPVMDGVEATRLIRQNHPDVAVVILTMTDDTVTRARAIAAGASDFIVKKRMDGTLFDAIRRAVGKESAG